MATGNNSESGVKSQNLDPDTQAQLLNNVQILEKAMELLGDFKNVTCKICSRIGFVKNRMYDPDGFICSIKCMAFVNTGFRSENFQSIPDIQNVVVNVPESGFIDESHQYSVNLGSFAPSKEDATKAHPNYFRPIVDQPPIVTDSNNAFANGEISDVPSQVGSVEQSPNKISPGIGFVSLMKSSPTQIRVERPRQEFPAVKRPEIQPLLGSSEMLMQIEPETMNGDFAGNGGDDLPELVTKALAQSEKGDVTSSMLAKARLRSTSPPKNTPRMSRSRSTKSPESVVTGRVINTFNARKAMSPEVGALFGHAAKKTMSTSSPPPLASKTLLPAKQAKWVMGKLKMSPNFFNGAKCCITHTWNLMKYTIVPAVDVRVIDEITLQLSEYCSKEPPITYFPAVHDVIYARYMEYVYRSEVIEVSMEKKEVRVDFFDYGDELTVELSECWEPHDEIMEKHPVYYGVTFECDLRREYPPPKEPVRIPTKIRSKAENEFVFMYSLSEEPRRQWKGMLYFDVEKTKSMNGLIERWIKKTIASEDDGKAPGSSTNPGCSKTPANNQSVAPSTADTKSPSSNVQGVQSSFVGAKRPNPSQSDASVPTVTSKQQGDQDINFKMTVGTAKISPNLTHGTKVRINFMWAFNKITVQAQDDDDGMEELQVVCEVYAKRAPGLARVPSVGEILLAPYGRIYYRAVVESIDADGAVHVQFVDFGDAVTVKPPELKELSPEIAAHPIYGVQLLLEAIPDNIPLDMVVEDFDSIMETGGQLEVTEYTSPMTWKGFLWLGAETTWNQMILDAMDLYRLGAPKTRA